MAGQQRKRMQCVVGPETVRMLELGHPWVIADKFTRQWPKLECGDLVELCGPDNQQLGTALIDPGARVIGRLLGTPNLELTPSWFRERLQAAAELRRWLHLGETTAWRLINAEGDGLPGLTIDRFGEFLQVQYYTAAWKPYLPAVTEALQDELQPAGVYAKFRPQETRALAGNKGQAPRARLLAGVKAAYDLTVTEHGLRYRIDLERDLHTGLFLDQRDNRAAFQKFCAGQKVLNLFSYTCAFSVAAAAAGALQVDSVDASQRYLDWGRENFRLNDIDTGGHGFIAGDCFAELDRLIEQGRQYDVILMDPPSFSTTRRSRFTTSGGTASLVQKACALLPIGGLLITSSNHQKIDLADYLKELRKGSLAAGRSLQVIDVAGQGGDFPYTVTFPEGRYLKYVVSVVR